MSDTVILVCPCCASPVDADADPNGEETQRLQCPCCGQVWHMLIDLERQALHSLH